MITSGFMLPLNSENMTMLIQAMLISMGTVVTCSWL